MTPYHYAVVQVRDGSLDAERRNVGVVVLSPTLRKAWVRRADLKQRAHLIGDAAAFVVGLLDALLAEAEEVVRHGDADVAHGWLRARTLPSEDALTLAEPAVGITHDVDAEVSRLRVRYLGAGPARSDSVAEQVRRRVLRELGVAAAPRAFESGPATWKFPAVWAAPAGPVVIHALTFSQKTAENVLDAAFHNIGRAGEVRRWCPEVQWVTIAQGPTSGGTGAAFERASALMSEAGLGVVAPNAAMVRAQLVRVSGWDGARFGEA